MEKDLGVFYNHYSSPSRTRRGPFWGLYPKNLVCFPKAVSVKCPSYGPQEPFILILVYTQLPAVCDNYHLSLPTIHAPEAFVHIRRPLDSPVFTDFRVIVSSDTQISPRKVINFRLVQVFLIVWMGVMTSKFFACSALAGTGSQTQYSCWIHNLFHPRIMGASPSKLDSISLRWPNLYFIDSLLSTKRYSKNILYIVFAKPGITNSSRIPENNH